MPVIRKGSFLQTNVHFYRELLMQSHKTSTVYLDIEKLMTAVYKPKLINKIFLFLLNACLSVHRCICAEKKTF